ncbi:MAG: hypothetical protein ACPGTP_01710 [Bacteroidia bacterium]
MKKAVSITLLLVLITHLAQANHGVEAIGHVIEFLFIQGSLVLLGIILLIAYFYKKKKSITRLNLLIGYTAILTAISVSFLPKERYDFQDWTRFWFPALTILCINILVISLHFWRNRNLSSKN